MANQLLLVCRVKGLLQLVFLLCSLHFLPINNRVAVQQRGLVYGFQQCGGFQWSVKVDSAGIFTLLTSCLVDLLG